MTETRTTQSTRTALITGASRGFGAATAQRLARDGWRVVVDARNSAELEQLARQYPTVVPVAGDINHAQHRDALAAAIGVLGRLDLLLNNASALGPSPLPRLERLEGNALREVIETNVIAPLQLIQLLLPTLRASNGVVVNVSSDAAVEAYVGWGGYGASKAALDQVTAVLGVEESALRIYSFDPGDMRTDMHQQAFPGEDISDRPEPESVVPALLQLLADRPPSARYRAAEFSSDALASDPLSSDALASDALASDALSSDALASDALR